MCFPQRQATPQVQERVVERRVEVPVEAPTKAPTKTDRASTKQVEDRRVRRNQSTRGFERHYRPPVEPTNEDDDVRRVVLGAG